MFVGAATVTEAPIAQNVSVDQIVKFTCATTNSQDLISWITTPHIAATIASQNIHGGGIRSVLSFTALLEHSNTIVRCIVTDLNTVVSTVYSALLLVQGESFFCRAYRNKSSL